MPTLGPLTSTLHLEAGGDAAPEVAWERYAQLDLWRTWSPQITGAEPRGERLRPGLRGMVRGPLGVGVSFEVTAVDEAARTWAWRVKVGPARLRLEHDVTSDGTGARTGLTVHGWTPLVLAYAPLARLAMSRLVRG